MKLSKEAISPIFALTMGDPAGIGPEIALKALTDPRVHSNVFIIGDSSVLEDTRKALNITTPLHNILSVNEFKDGCINVVNMNLIKAESFQPGKISSECGFAAFKYIEKSIDLAISGEIAGVITNPINKESLHLANFNYPGHTEIFAEKTGVIDYTMLFLLKNIGVAHVTTHCSVRNAIDLISKDRVETTIRLLHRGMRQLGIERPRIAVGGLNPHAGECGLFGDEEIVHIVPAITTCRNEDISVSGPYPPDTVFMRAFKGEFDGIVAMLHDHGFVALKSLDFEHGVNITIGLPIIRTSVGHGTAFDLVGKGVASSESLIDAIHAANLLYVNRKII
jgi:4-phospho-D-threonate 3-dehydrogenase / 4-phospho-D-erythronate 3-dehydrogenase